MVIIAIRNRVTEAEKIYYFIRELCVCVIAFVFSLSQHRRRSSFKSVIDTARTRMKNALDTLNNNLLACRHFFSVSFFSTLPFSFASLTFSLPFSRYLALFLSFFCPIHGEPSHSVEFVAL